MRRLLQSLKSRAALALSSDDAFLARAYREALGRPVDPVGRATFLPQLRDGRSRTSVLLELTRSEEGLARALASRTAAGEEEGRRIAIQQAYRALLGRDADAWGLSSYSAFLKEGHTPLEMALDLVKSDEFVRRVLKANLPKPSIRELRPDRFRTVRSADGTAEVPVFHAEGPADFDWLERMILEMGYYEAPGIWSFAISDDSRLMARMLSAFAPTKGLELGCSNGTLLKALLDLGIASEGVEISRLAIGKAFPEVKARIHHGDLLGLDLPADYDLVFGLDVFEHLNPNKLDAYLRRLHGLLRPGGYLFANVPAIGADEVFGTVCPVYLDAWRDDAAAGRLFSDLHVDDEGFPLHGHLVWADSPWWVCRFEDAGFRRQKDVEALFQARHGAYMTEMLPARKALYVFAKDRDDARHARVLAAAAAQEPMASPGRGAR